MEAKTTNTTYDSVLLQHWDAIELQTHLVKNRMNSDVTPQDMAALFVKHTDLNRSSYLQVLQYCSFFGDWQRDSKRGQLLSNTCVLTQKWETWVFSQNAHLTMWQKQTNPIKVWRTFFQIHWRFHHVSVKHLPYSSVTGASHFFWWGSFFASFHSDEATTFSHLISR